MRENHKRSIAKSISWRALATLTTMAIVFIFTESIAASLGVGVIQAIANTILYYFHERTWDKINWGIIKKQK